MGHAVKVAVGTAESFQSTIRNVTADLEEFSAKGKNRVALFSRSLASKLAR